MLDHILSSRTEILIDAWEVKWNQNIINKRVNKLYLKLNNNYDKLKIAEEFKQLFDIELLYFCNGYPKYQDYLGFDLLKFSRFLRISNGISINDDISVIDCIEKYCSDYSRRFICRLLRTYT